MSCRHPEAGSSGLGLSAHLGEFDRQPHWHDRQTEPNFAQARAKTGKVFLGGVKEGPAIVSGRLEYESIMASGGIDAEGIRRHIQEAVDMVGGKGVIVGPGCVADPKSPPELLKAVRMAVE